jgi:hypothetical protein
MRERVWVRRALWGSERCGNERAISAPDPEAAGGSAGMPARLVFKERQNEARQRCALGSFYKATRVSRSCCGH